MTYDEMISSNAVQEYFGKRHKKWQDELTKIVRKKAVSGEKISNTDAEKKIMQTTKFSFMGFLFNFIWLAYHNGKYWLAMSAFISAANTIDILFFNSSLGTPLSIAPAVLVAMYGKSYILAAKAEELAKNGTLSSPSWGRVFQAIAILVIPPTIAIFSTM